MKPGVLCAFLFILAACAGRSHSHVQVSPQYPSGNCREVGQVIGNANSRQNNAREQALDDLRYQAAQRQADYVRLIAVTAHGAAARGVAYRCR